MVTILTFQATGLRFFLTPKRYGLPRYPFRGHDWSNCPHTFIVCTRLLVVKIICVYKIDGTCFFLQKHTNKMQTYTVHYVTLVVMVGLGKVKTKSLKPPIPMSSMALNISGLLLNHRLCSIQNVNSDAVRRSQTETNHHYT